MIKGLSIDKYLGGEKILDNVNLNVKKGSVYGLIGPNGAGKTTLIKTLVGIYEPEDGEVSILGEGIKDNTKIKSILGYVSDYQNFYPNFKVEGMVDFYRKTYPLWNEDRYNDLSKIFKLDHKKKIKSLFKGMKTQLSLMLSFSITPKILILDEPTSGLDPVIKKKVLDLIIDEVSGNETTVIIASHHLGELERVCDQIGIIYEGKIIMEDSIDNLKANVRKVQVAFKDGLPDSIKNSQDILNIENRGRVYELIVKNNMEEVLVEIEKCDPLLLETIDMSLEEIFIYQMGGVGYVFEDISL